MSSRVRVGVLFPSDDSREFYAPVIMEVSDDDLRTMATNPESELWREFDEFVHRQLPEELIARAKEIT